MNKRELRRFKRQRVTMGYASWRGATCNCHGPPGKNSSFVARSILAQALRRLPPYLAESQKTFEAKFAKLD